MDYNKISLSLFPYFVFLNFSNFPIDVSGINSISVDWFTGQLYWASNFPRAIFAGLNDGRGYVKVLEKNLVPKQLITFPEKRYEFQCRQYCIYSIVIVT